MTIMTLPWATDAVNIPLLLVVFCNKIHTTNPAEKHRTARSGKEKSDADAVSC